jgi:poly-gamma-glutamate capsule biosynthesis protein CapA/YwtB (metallophosphatase superfamily)
VSEADQVRAPGASGDRLLVLALGDIILDLPDPDSYFAPSAPVLATGDVVIGQVETPYTERGEPSVTGATAPQTPPTQLDALARAGVNVATVAGNHTFDLGAPGVRDTLERLRGLGILTAGAGMTLAEARRPATVTSRGRTVSVLSYNAVGPRESWAGPEKPGCAFLRVLTHYELDHASPGGRPTVYTFTAPESLEVLEADVAAARGSCDLLVVVVHKGANGDTSTAWYEKQIAHTAIDAGADVVVGHHSHIMEGIEVHRGRPIFHGLGNFVTVTHALSTDARINQSTDRLAYARSRASLFGFTPDPDMPTYPFHPDSRHTIIARCALEADGTLSAGFTPCYIDRTGRPEPVRAEQGGERVLEYVRRITAQAGFDTALEWDGDGVRIVLPPALARA